MKIKTVSKVELTLDEDEIKTVRACLDYCSHRMDKHGKPEKGIDAKKLKSLRASFVIATGDSTINAVQHCIDDFANKKFVCFTCRGFGCTDCNYNRENYFV